MNAVRSRMLVGHLREWLTTQTASQANDRQLLEQFVGRGDGAAFASLVQRYGPLVLRVCRRQLDDDHDAEDAFQATFLVLARKAAAIRRQEAIGAWLHGVAYRIARRIRDSRRPMPADGPEPGRAADPRDEASWRETVALLDQELHALPAKYRVPLVLCYLNGQRQAEVGRQLGLPLRTLEHRLTQGRALLRRRLVRRGFEWSAVLLAVEFSTSSLPAALADNTVRSALAFASGQTTAGVAPAHVVALANHFIPTLNVGIIGRGVLALVLLISGAGLLANHLLSVLPEFVEHATNAMSAAAPIVSHQDAEDVLALEITAENKLKVPARNDLLGTPAEFAEFLKRHYAEALKAAQKRDGAEAEVKTLVRITADAKADYLPVDQLLRLCRLIGYQRLELPAIAVRTELGLKKEAATLLIKALVDGVNDGGISALIVRLPKDGGESAIPNLESLELYLKDKRNELPEKKAINLEADGQLKFGRVVEAAAVIGKAGFSHILLSEDEKERIRAEEDAKKPGGPDRAIDALSNAVRPQGTGDAARDAAVAAGLAWIVEHQAAAGHWSLHKFHQDGKCPCTEPGGSHDVAGTALALLSLVRAGHTHKNGAHARNVERSLKYVVARQDAEGKLSGMMYEHGLAALALCETYGRTGDPTLKGPAQRAINYIISAQHEAGGWRYAPRTPGDLSVSSWQIQALWSAQQAGLIVPEDTVKKALSFLDSVATADRSGYGYTPPPQFETPTMTACGLLSRSYLTGDPGPVPGLAMGMANLNKLPPSPNFRNKYYYYYATHVMNQDSTERLPWNRRMRQVLIDQQDWGEQAGHQHQKGSWSGEGDVWGSQLGRLGQTAFAILILRGPEQHWMNGNQAPSREARPDIEKLWKELTDANGFRATASMRQLVSAPLPTVTLLQDRLRPVVLPGVKGIERWIADLDNAKFETRQKAAEELEKLGEAAVPALHKALDGKPALEVRQRIDQILAKVVESRTPERLQAMRGIRVLEAIGSPEAQKVIRKLAQEGTPGAWQTREAQQALDRLAKRPDGNR